jgi:hypothetical protein
MAPTINPSDAEPTDLLVPSTKPTTEPTYDPAMPVSQPLPPKQHPFVSDNSPTPPVTGSTASPKPAVPTKPPHSEA